MAVDAEFDAPRRVAGQLDKQWPEVFVINVEVIMVDVDGLIAIELKLTVHLRSVERFRLLLCNSDEDNLVAYFPLSTEIVGDIVLPLFVLKLINRNLMPFRLCPYRSAELLRHLTQHHRRWNRLAQLRTHERHQPARRRQRPDVPVQVKPIQTLHLQSDVSVQ